VQIQYTAFLIYPGVLIQCTAPLIYPGV